MSWGMGTAPAQRLTRRSSACQGPAIACDEPTHCETSAAVSARTLQLTWFAVLRPPRRPVGGSYGLSTNAGMHAHTWGSRVSLACRYRKVLPLARSDQVAGVVTWLRATIWK
jgi:hypothetical protein